MGAAFLDEGDARPAVPAEGVAETGDELEPRRAAAYGPDMMDSDFLVSNRIGRWRLRRDIASKVDFSSGMLRSQPYRYRSTRIVAPEPSEQTPRLTRRRVSS